MQSVYAECDGKQNSDPEYVRECVWRAIAFLHPTLHGYVLRKLELHYGYNSVIGFATRKIREGSDSEEHMTKFLRNLNMCMTYVEFIGKLHSNIDRLYRIYALYTAIIWYPQAANVLDFAQYSEV